MNTCYSHLISSAVTVPGTLENAWETITTVEIAHFRFPWYFRLMNIPKPIRAEIVQEGAGGSRIAYFDNGKRFIQEIETWEKLHTYSFSFRSGDGFKAGYCFDLFNGVFRVRKGTYFLKILENGIRIELQTEYTIRKNSNWLLSIPARVVLNVFQRYLLHTIQANAEFASKATIL